MDKLTQATSRLSSVSSYLLSGLPPNKLSVKRGLIPQWPYLWLAVQWSDWDSKWNFRSAWCVKKELNIERKYLGSLSSYQMQRPSANDARWAAIASTITLEFIFFTPESRSSQSCRSDTCSIQSLDPSCRSDLWLMHRSSHSKDRIQIFSCEEQNLLILQESCLSKKFSGGHSKCVSLHFGSKQNYVEVLTDPELDWWTLWPLCLSWHS